MTQTHKATHCYCNTVSKMNNLIVLLRGCNVIYSKYSCSFNFIKAILQLHIVKFC